MSNWEAAIKNAKENPDVTWTDQMNSEQLSAAVSGRTGHVTVDHVPLEDEEQAAFVVWCRAHQDEYPGLDLMHAIPNGEYRNKATAGRLKAQGVLPGVPDIFIPVPFVRRRPNTIILQASYGLYIEMKRADKRLSRVESHQADIIERLRSQGYYVAVCYGCAEAIDVVERYFRGEL